MGFKEKFEGASGWVSLSHGKMFAKVNGEKKEIGAVSGFLIDLTIEEEVFKGQTYEKITLHLQDDEDDENILRISFPIGSGYCFSFFSMCPNIDYKSAIEISASEKNLESGNTYGQLFIKQDGKNLKWYYTKDNEAGKKVPKPKIVKVNGKDVRDYEARNNFIQKTFVGLLEKKIKKIFPDGRKKAELAVVKSGEDITIPMDDLPF